MLVCKNCQNEQESGKFCGICGGPLEEAGGSGGAAAGGSAGAGSAGGTGGNGASAGGSAVASGDASAAGSGGADGSASAETAGSGEIAQQQAAQEAAATGGAQAGAGSAAPVATAQAAGGSDTTESVKNGLASYWQFIVEMIKNPTKGLQSNDRFFIHGLVTIALFAITFSLSIYFLVNSLAKPFMLYSDESASLPFFQINSRLVFYMLIVLAITFFVAFGIAKLAKNADSFSVILAQYGSLFVPLVALNVIALLGGLIGSIGLTIAPLILATSLAISYVPILFVFEKATVVDNNGQRVYFAFATFAVISIVFYIFGKSFVLDLLANVENLINGFSRFPF